MSDLVVNGERVEASKENIQPLKKGRAVSALNTVLSTPLKERSSVFESEKARFEQMIASYTGDEPLNLWIEYVNWLEQNSPSGSPELGLLLKRATLQFQENEKYRNNLKYLKLWIRYAQNLEDPEEVFVFLFDKGIGVRKALLYEAWAVVLEGKKRYPEANEVYNRGLSRQAAPVERLKSRFEAFQQRFMVFLSSSSETDKKAVQSESHVLNKLSSKQAVLSHRSRSKENKDKGFGQINSMRPKPNEPVNVLPSVVHDENNVRYIHDKLPKNVLRPLDPSSKENSKTATTWNDPMDETKPHLHSRSKSLPNNPKLLEIPIYVDSEFEKEENSNFDITRVDLLKPSALQKETKVKVEKSQETKVKVEKSQETKAKLKKLAEPKNKTPVRQPSCSNSIPFQESISFEEARAMHYGLLDGMAKKVDEMCSPMEMTMNYSQIIKKIPNSVRKNLSADRLSSRNPAINPVTPMVVNSRVREHNTPKARISPHDAFETEFVIFEDIAASEDKNEDLDHVKPRPTLSKGPTPMKANINSDSVAFTIYEDTENITDVLNSANHYSSTPSKFSDGNITNTITAISPTATVTINTKLAMEHVFGMWKQDPKNSSSSGKANTAIDAENSEPLFEDPPEQTEQKIDTINFVELKGCVGYFDFKNHSAPFSVENLVDGSVDWLTLTDDRCYDVDNYVGSEGACHIFQVYDVNCEDDNASFTMVVEPAREQSLNNFYFSRYLLEEVDTSFSFRLVSPSEMFLYDDLSIEFYPSTSNLKLQDLFDLLKTTSYKLPRELSTWYVAEVLKTVGTIHSLGFTHGDISPSKFILRREFSTQLEEWIPGNQDYSKHHGFSLRGFERTREENDLSSFTSEISQVVSIVRILLSASEVDLSCGPTASSFFSSAENLATLSDCHEFCNSFSDQFSSDLHSVPGIGSILSTSICQLDGHLARFQRRLRS